MKPFRNIVVCLAMASLVASCSSKGPKQLVVGKHTCSHCGMHISYPSFSAQLQFDGRKTHFFDDPGCLILYSEEHRSSWASPPTATYYHHMESNAWVPEEEAGFVIVAESPMGYNVGVVFKGEGDRNPIPFEEAKKHVLGRFGR